MNSGVSWLTKATLVLKGSVAVLAPLQAHEALEAPFPGNLANLFIVSEVRLEETESATLVAEVTRAEGVKCSRCWTYSPAKEGAGAADPRGALCPRCSAVVAAGSAR